MSSIGKGIKHESAHKHVSGEASYTDDLPEPRDLLHAYVGLSTQAHARILRLNLDKVRTAAGVDHHGRCLRPVVYVEHAIRARRCRRSQRRDHRDHHGHSRGGDAGADTRIQGRHHGCVVVWRRHLG